jgi:hypothetical protein
MALMAISIDRYIGVTRPLNYSSIMTTRRTIYLIIVVWAVSILTSVVPLFGLTDREKKPNDLNIEQGRFETCKVNKNTFYTIFSSMISFYIPVIILLILYSRVYQEAQKQGQKLENEKRRLYQIDYQIASEHVRRKENPTNGHTTDQQNIDQRTPVQTPTHKRTHSSIPDVHPNEVKPKNKRTHSSIPDVDQNEVTTTLINNGNVPDEVFDLDRTLPINNEVQKDYSDLKV